MTKAPRFLDIPRREPEKQSVEERLTHFREIYREFTERELTEQASRCMDCGVPFCHGFGCPLGNLIPAWNDLVAQGRWREANELLHQRNNFPEITGRVCPAPCEKACVNAIHGEAVSIRQIELTVVEKAWREGWLAPRPPETLTGRSVAVIGSGPSGLAAAQQLRRAGHEVTVYERDARAGGILRYGIPHFKLEKRVLDRRLEQLEGEGVRFETGVQAGVDVSAAYLLKKYDALCLCGGAGEPRDIHVPGRNARGIHFSMDFLVQQNRRDESAEIPEAAAIHAKGKRVVIIGGGDTGADCLGTALRQGAAGVVQLELLPRPPEARPEENPWPLWPQVLRTSSSHEEGGERRWSVHTTRFTTEGGRVNGLDCVRVAWMRNAQTGRMEMAPEAGSEFHLPAELVLLAMGFLGPVRKGLLDDLGVACDARGNVQTDENLASSKPGIFAAGDMRSGANLVVRGIAAGRRMARRVDLYLMGESSLPDCEPPPELI